MRIPMLLTAVAVASIAGAAAGQTPSPLDLLGRAARSLPASPRPLPPTPTSTSTSSPMAADPVRQLRPDHTANPAGAATRSGGFSPDVTHRMTAGGGFDAAQLGGGCVGMISSAPSFAFTYTAGGRPLFMNVRSQGDTTLVVRNPDGAFGCSDDYIGLNPALRWDRPASGTYHVWIGSVGVPADAVLTITERE